MLAAFRRPYASRILSSLPHGGRPHQENLNRAYAVQTGNTDANKVVFISQSSDVYSNLAFETWLYNKCTFDDRQLLFLWRNSPCVVIGRHQNPYKEANLSYLESARVPVVRRHSGGGTVYHDDGNLNCTFFTPRARYNRRWNLELICRALEADFGFQLMINSRDDILASEKYKVSGSAAKLGRVNAYHHCSLLVNTDRTQLSLALRGDHSLECSATASVPSPVTNISNGGSVSVDRVQQSLASHYLDAALQGQQHNPEYHRQRSDGVTLINPMNDWFPGLGKFRDELVSEDWIYRRTPRFKKSVTIRVPEELRCGESGCDTTVVITCKRGLVEELTLDAASSLVAGDALKAAIQENVALPLLGTPYTLQLSHVVNALLASSADMKLNAS